LGHRFERFDILAGYRYLSWEFEDNAALDIVYDLADRLGMSASETQVRVQPVVIPF